ncbi:MAG: tetratricopeptide repeat protein [Planctomycetes bacterium]|nr:tetratricopeptide repeat protein [Planctomycetota bacterium]
MKTILMALVVLGLVAGGLLAQGELEEARKLFEAGRYADAGRLYDRLQSERPEDFEAVMGFGRSLYMQHESNRSLALFERAHKLRAEAMEPLLWQGHVLERSGMEGLERSALLARATLADALAAYRRASELDPDQLEPRRSAVRVLFVLERFDEALNEVAAALKLAPDDRDLIANRLGLLYRSARYEDFLVACRDHGEQMPGGLDWILDANARLGRVAETTAVFERMFAEGWAGRSEPYAVLARAWAKEPLLEEQIKLLRHHLEIHPEEWLGHSYLGYALAVAGRLDEARTEFEAFLGSCPEDVNTLAHLAHIARLQGRLDDAGRLARELLVAAPDSDVARTETASVVAALVEQRNWTAALELHHRLYDLDPGDVDLARNQAVLLRDNGRPEQSLAILDQIIAEAPIETSRLAAMMNERALCLKGLGRIDEAIRAFEEAGRTWERQADAPENLGVMLARLGRKEEARKALEAAIAARRAAGETGTQANWRARYHLRALRR